MEKRLGLFGGSFDPIHNGHLYLLEEARRGLALERVVLLPAAVSPFKQKRRAGASGADRLAMCRLAVEHMPWCSVSEWEVRQAGVSYSYETVSHYHGQFPAAKLVWLMGSDMFLTFQNWYRWRDMLRLCALGVLAREERDFQRIRAQYIELSKFGTIFLCNTDVYPISSTEIRQKRKNGEDFSCHLPEKVVKYIVRHNLYVE